MATYSKTYRATASPSTSSKISNPERAYDDDVSSYASRNNTSVSSLHVNGFGINLPSNAVVESLTISSKMYASSSNGYLCVYVLSDAAPSISTPLWKNVVVDGKAFAANYISHVYSSEQISAKLTELGLHNGNAVEFLKNLQVALTIGSKSSTSKVTTYIYDNHVVVTYSIPDYTLTVNASPSEGGTVSGGGVYEEGWSATIVATPNVGYKFVQWSDGNTSPSRAVIVSGDATYTAQFELDKINKIYVGTQQPKEIYVGTTPVKAIYVGTTKVYG